MQPLRLTALAAALGMAAALGATLACGSTTPSASEDERGSVGVPPTAAEYCTKLGFTLTDSQCTFPDGTSCEEWAFYRGECGQAHSYCNQHGGTISSVTEDAGSYTAVYGICSVNGQQCQESSFVQTGKCP
jgi:putative hemolysin